MKGAKQFAENSFASAQGKVEAVKLCKPNFDGCVHGPNLLAPKAPKLKFRSPTTRETLNCRRLINSNRHNGAPSSSGHLATLASVSSRHSHQSTKHRTMDKQRPIGLHMLLKPYSSETPHYNDSKPCRKANSHHDESSATPSSTSPKINGGLRITLDIWQKTSPTYLPIPHT